MTSDKNRMTNQCDWFVCVNRYKFYSNTTQYQLYKRKEIKSMLTVDCNQ